MARPTRSPVAVGELLRLPAAAEDGLLVQVLDVEAVHHLRVVLLDARVEALALLRGAAVPVGQVQRVGGAHRGQRPGQQLRRQARVCPVCATRCVQRGECGVRID